MTVADHVIPVRHMFADEQYYHPRTSASVIAIGDGHEALLIRSVLESLGAVVLLHLIGTPEDFLLTLEHTRQDPKFVVICGHGDANGLVFGDYANEVDTSPLIDGSLPATAIAARACLPEAVVLSTACLSGNRRFGQAFLDAGAAAYVAPADYPDGADIALFVHLFFHAVIQRKQRVEDAFNRLHDFDPVFEMLRLYHSPQPTT